MTGLRSQRPRPIALSDLLRTLVFLAIVPAVGACVPSGVQRAEFLEVVPERTEARDAFVQEYRDVIAFFEQIRFGMQQPQVVDAVGAAGEEVAGGEVLGAFEVPGDATVARWVCARWDIYLVFENANGVLSRAILVDRKRNVGAERVFASAVYSAPAMGSIIRPGMSEAQTLVLLGKPSEVVRSTHAGSVEIWFVWPIAEWSRVAFGVVIAEDGRVLLTGVSALAWFRKISEPRPGDQ